MRPPAAPEPTEPGERGGGPAEGGSRPRRMAALSGGSAFHERTLHLPRYRRFLEGIVYLGDLGDGDLDPFDVVLVPDRLHLRRLTGAARHLLAVLERGGALVVLGEHLMSSEPTGPARSWLPGACWEHRPANFWWWLERGARSGLVAVRPDHSLFRYVTLDDATWHHHGVLYPPEGAETVVGTGDGAAVVYVDRVSSPGTIVAANARSRLPRRLLLHAGGRPLPRRSVPMDGRGPVGGSAPGTPGTRAPRVPGRKRYPSGVSSEDMAAGSGDGQAAVASASAVLRASRWPRQRVRRWHGSRMGQELQLSAPWGSGSGAVR